MQPKDFLLIGHITRDLAPNGEFIPGGPVTYAGIALAKRGHNVQILTKAANNDPLLDFIRENGIDIQNLSPEGDTHTTTYTNKYDTFQNRTQHVSDIAAPFRNDEIPFLTELAKGKRTLVLPVANEIPHTVYKPLVNSAEMLIAAPQGSLRRWDSDGKVFHKPFSNEYINALKHCHIATLSAEDMEGFDTEVKAHILHSTSDTVILTNGRDGAHMFQNNHVTDVPPFRLSYVEERDGYPTGNGDHMTAIIAEGAPSYLQKLTDPYQYEQDMFQAAARGAFFTALKIIKREGVTDGIGSLRDQREVNEWILRNPARLRDYADMTNLEPSVFFEGQAYFQEGNQNRFHLR